MLEQIIHNIETQGFCVIPGFISETRLERINAFIDEKKTEFTPARVGHGTQKLRDETIRGDYTLWLDSLLPEAEFLEVTNQLDELQAQLNKKLFLGLKDFEYHLAYYPTSYFYRRHVDAHEKGSSRIFSFVFYLNQEWSEADGGELVLYHRDGEILKTIVPAPGLFVGFLSHEFPHEVKPCHKERRSLTGWMHNKILN